MSSVRIDLTGGGGLCGRGVDRSKPAQLSSYMQDYEWEQFCDGIDAALRPVSLGMKIAFASFGVTFLATIICMIVFVTSSFSSFPSGGGSSFDDDFFSGGSGSGSGGVNPALWFALPAGFMGLTMLGFFFAMYKAGQSRGEMNRVCREVSDRKPRLSFHVRYERIYYGYGYGYGHHSDHSNYRSDQYIEVSIDNNNVAEAAAYVPPSAPSAPPASLQTKLTDLEEARHLLTADEYNMKRADILASV